MDTEAFGPEVQPLLIEYRNALPQRLELATIVRILDRHPLSDAKLLDVGVPNPAMSLLLRQRGGAWSTVARSPELAETTQRILGGTVTALSPDGSLPFEERTFEWVVVALGVLTSMPDAEAFVHECHRMLRPTGQLIVSTQQVKPFSLINWVRRASGETAAQRGNVRVGYNERELFALIKTGFDVIELDSYARFFVELVRIWELRARRRSSSSGRVSRVAGVLYRLADSLDWLGRGHVLTAHCRRRQWKPRTLPVLSDGRTIHEAVLQRTSR